MFDTVYGTALPITKLQHILGLPSLRSIRGYRVDLCGLELARFEDLKSLPHPNLKEISLERSFVDCPGGMEALLRIYERLDILSMRRGTPCARAHKYPRDEYSGIGDALRKHGKKLLSLDVLQGDLDDDNLIEWEPLGSLVPLTSLRRLKATYDVLYGGAPGLNNRPITWLQEILPRSLESFDVTHVVFQGDSHRLDEQVKALIGDKEFEKLDSIRIRRRSDGFPPEEAPDGWEVVDKEWCFELGRIGSLRKKNAGCDDETAESDEETAESDEETAESDEGY